MRYVAKIYVLDVLDQVVLSGYVYDADEMTSPDHEPYEFTLSAPGLGLNDPYAWLLNSVYRCLVEQPKPPPRGSETGATGVVL